MEQKLLWRQRIVEAIQKPSPPQVIRQIFCRHAMKPGHPGLETGVIAVDVLNMPGSFAALAVIGRDKVPRLHVQRFGDFPVGGIAIRTQHGAVPNAGRSASVNALAVLFGKT